MKVFKFGGASVKDADAVKNVSHILSRYKNEKLIVVVSAMGKTTNKLEDLVAAKISHDSIKFENLLNELQGYHYEILNELFPTELHPIYQFCFDLFEKLRLDYHELPYDHFSLVYDQIVSKGEVLSSHILAEYLKFSQFSAAWFDVRKLIRTDDSFQAAKVDWETTETLTRENLLPMFTSCDIIVTQGFIGHTEKGLTTTLGREGSDYTAGILAYCTNATNVTIWKDVPGMLNADPKFFKDTVKLDSISFKEAIELSYYGASVIHPKTIQPLQNKGIPLLVKSFINPGESGSLIQESTVKDHLIPSFISKKNQILFSITTRDFSFIMEEHLKDIFDRILLMKLTINLMQNSALDFSVLLDRSKVDPPKFIEEFNDLYSVRYNEDLELMTVRHYDSETLARLIQNKEVILEQKTRQTARIVMKDITLNE